MDTNCHTFDADHPECIYISISTDIILCSSIYDGHKHPHGYPYFQPNAYTNSYADSHAHVMYYKLLCLSSGICMSRRLHSFCVNLQHLLYSHNELCLRCRRNSLCRYVSRGGHTGLVPIRLDLYRGCTVSDYSCCNGGVFIWLVQIGLVLSAARMFGCSLRHCGRQRCPRLFYRKLQRGCEEYGVELVLLHERWRSRRLLGEYECEYSVW